MCCSAYAANSDRLFAYRRSASECRRREHLRRAGRFAALMGGARIPEPRSACPFETEHEDERMTGALARAGLAAAVCLLAGAWLAGAAAESVPVRDAAPGRAAWLTSLLDDETSEHVMVVAHRACWAGGAPENSLSAIDACIALGVDMIEIDVTATADGAVVLMHDETVDRTTDGTGRIADMTLAEARALRLRAADGGAHALLTEETVPTLRRVLERARGKILINLDVKGGAFDRAFAVVEELGAGGEIVMKMA